MLAAASGAQAHSTICYRSASEETHCYAKSYWWPTPGYFAEGALVKIDTITGGLPGWEEGDFYTNEMWVNFREHHWAETGQAAEGSEEGLRLFWARNNAAGYKENEPWYPEYTPYNSWATFKEQYEPSKCAQCWGVWINNTGVQVDEKLEAHAQDLEAGLEMTDTNITNTSESTEAYWEESGTWHGSWVAGGEGSETALQGPVKGDVPACVKTIDTDWAYFYGAKPCGQNGWEPSDAMPAGAVSTQLSIAGQPSSPEQAALQRSIKSGEPTPTIEQVGKNVPVAAVEFDSAEAQGTTTTRLADTYVLHGHFRVSGSVPQGQEAPTGTVMKLTVNPEDNEIVEEVLE
jgi:hypothetical protein